MTRAKDISKILTDADLSGTLDVTGTVTAGGLTVEQSGNDVSVQFNNTNNDFTTATSSALRLSTTASDNNLYYGEIKVQENSADTSSTNMLFYPKVNQLAMKLNNNGDISFYEDTGTTPKFFWDASTERLGIGTSSPSRQLHISNASESNIRLQGGADYAELRVKDADNALSFHYGGTERMRIDSSGNVGIGTSTIQSFAKLEIEGSAGAQTGANQALYIKAPSTTAGQGVGIRLSAASGSNEAVGIIGMVNNSSGTSGSMTFHTYNGGADVPERMRIDSAGRVGIGQSSPNTLLHLKADDPTIFLEDNSPDDSRGASIHSAAGDLFLRTGDNLDTGSPTVNAEVVLTDGNNIIFRNNASTERVRINSSGNVGIGTSSPATLLNLSATNPVLRLNGSTSGNCEIQTDGASLLINADSGNTVSSSNIAFRVDNTERIQTGSVGSTFMAADSGYNVLTLSSTGAITNTRFMRFNINGSITTGTEVGSIQYNGTGTSYITSSDYRLKENVTADWDATTRLKQLNPVRFNFTTNPDITVDGFLAHEVQSVVPEAISGTHNEVDADGNPVYQGIDQSKLVPLLVKTIQELEARIVALETA